MAATGMSVDNFQVLELSMNFMVSKIQRLNVHHSITI